MPIMYLPIAVKNVGITLEDILTSMGASPSYKLLYFDRISSLYRQLGIGEYLMSNNASDLFIKLQLSIQAYIEFLEHADVAEKATSRAIAFFDAICVGNKQAMHKIAQLSPRSVNKRKEYEEDYLYLRILMDYFGLDKSRDEIQSLLNEYEDFHSDNADERFNLIVALLEKDEIGFNESIEYLISEKLEQYKDGGSLYKGTLEESAILANVSTEVIAWLKLAQKQSIQLHGEYALAPGSTLAESNIQPPSKQSWLKCDTYKSLNDEHP